MRRSYFFGCLLFLLFLNSCATTLPPLMVSKPGDLAPEEWMEYGAYYEYDELRIFTEELYPDRGWSSCYYVNQKLHILNRKGLKYGTVEVPKYGDSIFNFSVTLWDPSGNEVPLDQKAIRSKYFETGKIIVPKVVAGCQIGIKVIFGIDNLVYSHEQWFEKPIPVLNARFSLFYPKNVKYVYKPYGSVAPVELQRLGTYIGYVWDLKNVMPEDDVFENRWHIDREPHVMARINSWYWQHINYDAPDWEGLARKAKAYFLSPSIFTSTSNIKEIIDSINNNQNGTFEKADAILAYVQEEISLAPQKGVKIDSIKLNTILSEKSGNRFEIAVLLKQMFEVAGFSARICITRPLNWGGFDPDLPSWRQIDYPLVAVGINGKELIAYPYNRLMVLGEYPFVFHDLQALDIENGKIEALPKSTYTDAKRLSLAILSPDKWEDTHPWQFTYSGEYATLIRNKMDSRTTDKRKAYFRSVIRGYDRENELLDTSRMMIERKGEIKLALECRNSAFKTQRADLSHYSLRPWFRKYFTDYDISRKVNYTNDMALIYEDSVLIKKDKNAQRSYRFECVNLDNPLFCSQCNQKETNDGMLLSRKLTVKQTDLTPEQMQSIYPDIVKLNRIDESYIIEKH